MKRASFCAAVAVVALLSAGVGQAAAPTTTFTSGPASITRSTSATFVFSADDPAATFGCALDQAPFATCSSPQSLSGLSDGRHVFYVLASGSGGSEVAPVYWVWTVDRAPPAKPSGVRVSVGYGRLRLSWRLSDSTGATSAVVKRGTDAKQTAQTRVYEGSGSSYTDSHFRNAAFHRYEVVALDAAGNASAGVSIDVRASALLLAPRAGATTRSAPTMRWRGVVGASYYNMQLFRGGRKVLSAWPKQPRWRLAHRWTYGGHRQALERGAYTWYVWPAFGPRARAAYGQLLGQSSFRVS
jgi:hypothetical protein